MASNILAKLAVLITGDSAGLNKSIASTNKQLTGFEKATAAVSRNIAATIGAISFAALGKEIIQITSEFQKFEAVLTNTLGSNSEAQDALDRIREFAAKTPFSVNELTSSFVKLANQGFEPTADEMRKLGDLASSTGKSFDQLTEAIIDAQTGEFERLKEFGIRASKSGDQVRFTFKGVETQTKFTADSIRDYLLSLGELEGVSGSMAAISGTLGGSLSNLGDSFDNLLLTLGTLTSGPAKDFIDFLNDTIKGISDLASGNTGLTTVQSKVNEEFVDGAKSVEDINKNIEKLTRFQKQAADESANLAAQTGSTAEEIQKIEKDWQSAKDFANAYAIAIQLLTEKLGKLEKSQNAASPSLSIIQKINADLKHFEELKNQSFSIDQIGAFNVKLQQLRDELEFINATGSESAFLKNLNNQQAAGQAPDLGLPKDAATPISPFDTTVAIDTAPYIEALQEMSQARDDFAVSEETHTAASIARQNALIAKQQEQASVAAQVGDIIGQSFADAASGQITFVQAIKKTTAELVKMFLQRALAGIISSAATSGGPPPVAIALAAAGVAAISAMFAKIGAPSGGGGASGPVGTQVQRIGSAGRAEDRIMLGGEFRVQGNDLVLAIDNTNNRKQRTG